MRIIIATVQVPFVQGGAEVLAADLLGALREHGHEAEIVAIPFKTHPPERIMDQMLACRLLDLDEFNGKAVDKVIALKFPAYLIPHKNKVLWLIHQHRVAYDLWDHPFGSLKRDPWGMVVREMIREADRQLIPDAKSLFTISKNVTRRLSHYCGIESVPLYPPVRGAEEYFCAEQTGEYFFFPSRLSASKRQELVLEALAKARRDVRVRFAGSPDSPRDFEDLKRRSSELGLENRVEWMGCISEEEKREAYARAIAVVFPPVDEDYGYVTLEAMLSSKPVITCSDSGGCLEFVEHGRNGLVTAPTPEALAEAFNKLWQDRSLAADYGRAARKTYEQLGLSWSNVVTTLLA